MAKKNIRSDQDGPFGDILKKDEQNFEIKMANMPDLSNNPDAKSFLSQGRGCPDCATHLRIMELNEKTGVLWVYCPACGGRWGTDDLDTDAIYRDIPQEMVLRYANRIDRSK